MNAGSKLAALNKFRSPGSMTRSSSTKVLVVYDVQVKTPDVSQIPLVINYGHLPLLPVFIHAHGHLPADLPKAVEEYAHRSAIHDYRL
jgi:hypothetical protein